MPQITVRCSAAQLSAWQRAAALDYRPLAAWARLALAKRLTAADDEAGECVVGIPIPATTDKAVTKAANRLGVSKSAVVRAALNAAARDSELAKQGYIDAHD